MNLNVSRLGQENLSGSPLALFLKVFAGEVAVAFDVENVMMPLHRVRTITHGRSAQFPYIGSVNASYHVPGAEMTGSQIPHAEQVINIDGLLVANTSIANIDEAMNHYDVRGPYAQELARALARTFDARLLRVVARAARTHGFVNGTPYNNSGASGVVPANYTGDASATYRVRDTELQDASAKTSATVLISKLIKAAQRLDERNAPASGRYAALAPAQYYLLVANGGTQVGSVMHRDWGGSGSLASGKVYEVSGLTLVKTNNFPSTLVTSDTKAATSGNNYNGDFTKTAALVWQEQAVGTVKLLDIATEAEYTARHQATFMVAKYAMGHGVLRPECAIEIGTGDIDAANVLPNS